MFSTICSKGLLRYNSNVQLSVTLFINVFDRFMTVFRPFLSEDGLKTVKNFHGYVGRSETFMLNKINCPKIFQNHVHDTVAFTFQNWKINFININFISYLKKFGLTARKCNISWLRIIVKFFIIRSQV